MRPRTTPVHPPFAAIMRIHCPSGESDSDPHECAGSFEGTGIDHPACRAKRAIDEGRRRGWDSYNCCVLKARGLPDFRVHTLRHISSKCRVRPVLKMLLRRARGSVSLRRANPTLNGTGRVAWNIRTYTFASMQLRTLGTRRHRRPNSLPKLGVRDGRCPLRPALHVLRMVVTLDAEDAPTTCGAEDSVTTLNACDAFRNRTWRAGR